MAIKKDTLDQLLAGRDPKEVFNKDGLFDELKKALAERVLNAEIDDHLDGEATAGRRNSRNGYSKKTVLTETSKLDLRIPRDREGTFDPKLIQRYQRRFPDGDRRGSGDGRRMAEPAVGADVSAGFLRRVAGQNPRRGAGSQQGRLCRARRHAGRQLPTPPCHRARSLNPWGTWIAVICSSSAKSN